MNGLRAAPSRLVIGFGNAWRGDDGVGAAVIQRLLASPSLARHVETGELRCVACLQLVPELALEVAAVDRVILVDAAIDQAPGTLRVRRVSANGGVPLQGHRWSPGSLATLAFSVAGRCPPLTAYTVGGESFEVEEGLTPAVERAVERLVQHWTSRWSRCS